MRVDEVAGSVCVTLGYGRGDRGAGSGAGGPDGVVGGAGGVGAQGRARQMLLATS